MATRPTDRDLLQELMGLLHQEPIPGDTDFEPLWANAKAAGEQPHDRSRVRAAEAPAHRGDPRPTFPL